MVKCKHLHKLFKVLKSSFFFTKVVIAREDLGMIIHFKFQIGSENEEETFFNKLRDGGCLSMRALSVIQLDSYIS